MCSRNPFVSVHQLALLWEAAFTFSEFFLEAPSTRLSISWCDLRVHLPTPRWVSSSFQPKMEWLPAPPSLLTQSHPEQFFFSCFPGWKKTFKGKCFADMEEVKQKMAKPLKGIKLMSSKLFWAVEKNASIVVLHQMESPLKVTEV